MGRHIDPKASGTYRRSEAFTHAFDSTAVPLDDRIFRQALPMPSPHMREQPSREFYRRLTFFRLPTANGAAIENPLIEVDVTTPNGGQ